MGDDNIAWSQKDIASYLDDGMNPAGDFAGSGMAEVIRNTEALSAADREAIAAYIASLPPRQGPKRPPKRSRKFKVPSWPGLSRLVPVDLDRMDCAWPIGMPGATAGHDAERYDPPNALKVMMVRVSCTPGTVCTFWAMKCPISVALLDVEFHQQIEIAGGRIDLRSNLGVGQPVGDLVGLAELALDLHEERNHANPPPKA